MEFFRDIFETIFWPILSKRRKKRALAKRRKKRLSLKRTKKNPVITPSEYSWESQATFNPAAVYLNGRVHLLYRAMGWDGQSVLGYASSADGINFDERLSEPAYIPREAFETDAPEVPPEKRQYDPVLFHSGGGWSGCEDPKLTVIGNRVYLTYVAFAGWESVRIAMSSISTTDFLNKNWNWTVPVLITPPGIITKSAGFFPEKIRGKYWFFYRIFPHVRLNALNNLEFRKAIDLFEDQKTLETKIGEWDGGKFSFGAPPIKTDEGWLVIYHAVTGRQEWENADLRYKMGAMLLDLKDPTKMIARSPQPILEPDEWYENDWKPGILYPGGAVIKDEKLFVYYGGGDKHVAVATAKLKRFLTELKRGAKPELTKQKTQIT